MSPYDRAQLRAVSSALSAHPFAAYVQVFGQQMPRANARKLERDLWDKLKAAKAANEPVDYGSPYAVRRVA